NAMASVLSEQNTILDGRTAAYRTARAQVDAAAQNALTLLASATQYSQLSLDGFRAQIATATAGVPSVHGAAGFVPLLAQLQQTAASIQGLLDSRSNAFGQLSAARATLASAQSIGASVGNIPATINALAGGVGVAGDHGTFDWLSSQLWSAQQVLSRPV